MTRFLRVHWHKTRGGRWFDFWKCDLSMVQGIVGIYVIALEMQGQLYRWAFYIGEGKISDRLKSHRKRTNFKECSSGGRLVFTWTELPQKRTAQDIEGTMIRRLLPLLSLACGIGGTEVNFPRFLAPWPWEEELS